MPVFSFGSTRPPPADPGPACHAIVLAAGGSRRFEELTRRIDGRVVPKQYASFGSVRSLLQQTICRVADLCLVERQHVVVDALQVPLAERQVPHGDRLRLVVQPADRGTAPAVMLSLLGILEEDPEAAVLVTPADHAVGEPEIFRRGICRAVRALGAGVADIVLLGAEADSPAADYTWIRPGRDLGHGARVVGDIVEVADALESAELYTCGALWSTGVVVARAEALWNAVARAIPGLAVRFRSARMLPGSERDEFLRRRYAGMRAFDLERHVLAQVEGLAVVDWPVELEWTGLGEPFRLLDWLRRESAVREVPHGTAAPRDLQGE